MDPCKQGALNRTENSVYRTAFKLRCMQTLCQLDLIDSSLIQQVLLHGRFGESTEISLSIHQLFQELQELFQRTGMGKTAQVHPRAPELTLSLLMAIYDSTGSGILKLRPVAAALFALSGDSPLTKYRAFFQLYLENNRRGNDSRARMTRKGLRALLTDLQQILTVMGESCTLCSVESAIHSCFRGVLSSGIKEEKFLSWVQSEPLILLWLPACYQLSASEMLAHPVRCSICRTFPIIGLRYRCLKCLNFDICQLCFLSGLHSKSHQKSHAMMEDCVQMSSKENTKLFFRNLRNSLPQKGDRTGAMGRQWLLDQLAPRHPASHGQARFTLHMTVHISKNYTFIYKDIIGSFALSLKALKSQCVQGQQERWRQRPQNAPDTHVKDCHLLHKQMTNHVTRKTIVSIKKELWRTHDFINTLHRERRLLRKQLNRYKHKLQGTYTLQKEQNCRLETKIRELATNQDNLWTKLQQMRQDLQAMLQPLHPSLPLQNTASKTDHSLPDNELRRGGDSSHIKSVIRDGPEWELLPKSTKTDRNHKCQARSEKALPDSEPPEVILQGTRTQSHPQKMLREVHASPSACQEQQQNNPRIPPAEVSSPALASSAGEEVDHISERLIDLEEEELQTLLPRLLDAFDQDTPSGPKPSEDMELYGRAEQVCRAFSALVDQIISPSLE
ncbi:dystrotelin [Phodopus roborovskii]|uniref:dystrotelin n=1 Tax=Phodopus roborovskii TaxID=109678 RepID=UPI0021E3DEAC|nr:dystrotelin [Phodopus roborovskii]